MKHAVGVVVLASFAALCVMIGGCDDEERADEAATAPSEAEVEPEESAGPATESSRKRDHWRATDLDLPDVARPYSNVLSASQPTKEQLEGLGETEIQTVISLRESDEDGAVDAASILEAQGIEFVRIPMSLDGAPTADQVERLHEALKVSEGESLIYCGSSDRVGAAISLRAQTYLNANPIDALRRGQVAGLDGLESDVRSALYKN